MSKKWKLAASLIGALALLAGLAPPANAYAYITWHYDAECMRPGVYYAGMPYTPYRIRKVWFRDYHMSTAEKLRGLRDYSEYSHVQHTRIRCNFA